MLAAQSMLALSRFWPQGIFKGWGVCVCVCVRMQFVPIIYLATRPHLQSAGLALLHRVVQHICHSIKVPVCSP